MYVQQIDRVVEIVEEALQGRTIMAASVLSALNNGTDTSTQTPPRRLDLGLVAGSLPIHGTTTIDIPCSCVRLAFHLAARGSGTSAVQYFLRLVSQLTVTNVPTVKGVGDQSACPGNKMSLAIIAQPVILPSHPDHITIGCHCGRTSNSVLEE